jgi:hypothetical protein
MWDFHGIMPTSHEIKKKLSTQASSVWGQKHNKHTFNENCHLFIKWRSHKIHILEENCHWYIKWHSKENTTKSYTNFVLQKLLLKDGGKHILIGYYTVLCTVWKDIVRVCIVLKTASRPIRVFNTIRTSTIYFHIVHNTV